MREEWKNIGDGLYQVSNLGRVRAMYFANRHGKLKRETPKLLTPHLHTKGYWRVTLHVEGKRKSIYIHKLILEAFVGPCPEGYECAHLDGVRTNCAVENLAWVTRKENHSHKKLHGTHQIGEKNGFAKLTNAQVVAIRVDLAAGVSQRKIATKYNVSARTIGDIRHGRSWSSVKAALAGGGRR